MGLLDYLIVKEHLMCRPEDATPVLSLRRHTAVWIGPEDGLMDLQVDGTVHWVACRDLGCHAR